MNAFSHNLMIIPVIILTIALLIRLCLIYADAFSGMRKIIKRTTHEPPNSPNYKFRFFNLFLTEVELMAASMLIMLFFSPKLVSSSPDDISDNINIIADSLVEASEELSSIQQALEARVEFVEDLKKQAEIAENVISLSEEQVNAVQAKINQELEASSGKKHYCYHSNFCLLFHFRSNSTTIL